MGNLIFQLIKFGFQALPEALLTRVLTWGTGKILKFLPKVLVLKFSLRSVLTDGDSTGGSWVHIWWLSLHVHVILGKKNCNIHDYSKKPKAINRKWSTVNSEQENVTHVLH